MEIPTNSFMPVMSAVDSDEDMNKYLPPMSNNAVACARPESEDRTDLASTTLDISQSSAYNKADGDKTITAGSVSTGDDGKTVASEDLFNTSRTPLQTQVKQAYNQEDSDSDDYNKKVLQAD